MQDQTLKTLMARYGRQTFWIMLTLVCYIQLRYECEEAIYDIDSLKRELDDVRYTSIARWGELTGLNKPEKVRHNVEQGGSRLTTSTEPPVKL